MLGLALYALIMLGALLCAYYLGLFTGALYVPTDAKMTEDMLDVAGLKEGDRLVDLGSGDGRLIIAAARRGIAADGYEVNPLLVWLSRRKAQEAGVEELAHFYWRDFWSVDLSQYSAVMVFGIAHIMRRLERKLERELAPGSRVVCNLFPLPDWDGRNTGGMFVYER